MAGVGIARAPPQQKIGDSYTFHITPGRIRATPRRSVVRGLLAKIASGTFKDISYSEYQARKITLSKGMLPPVAAIVAAELPHAYPDSLRKQTQDAFMKGRKDRHAQAAGVIARGEQALRIVA